MNFAPDNEIEPVPVPKPRTPKTARSPVGETMGDIGQPKQRWDKDQILSETALEVANNY
jgi:hypothetical protein